MDNMKFSNNFAVGADIGWYPQMLESGFVFCNRAGEEQNLLLTLKELGMNSIRLRTWVDPSDDRHSGHCSAEETLQLAKQCQELGFRIMINFHYSDSWCDPGQQRKPKQWEHLSFDELVQALYQYTHDTLTYFRENGLVVEWVQIGNETNPGMLLPDGSTENFDQLTRLYNAGHDAVKAVMPETKTMIHLAEFNTTPFIINYFDQLEERGCRYDMMGFSFYPYWLPNLTLEQCMEGFRRSLQEIPNRYNKEFMIVEIGGVDEQEEETYQLFTDVIQLLHTEPRCKGLFLWEPQGARVWSDYKLSAWRADGTPSKAMDAFAIIQS